MLYAAKTGPRGVQVQYNMTALAVNLAQGATEMQISADIFANSTVVTIGEEDVTVTARGTTATITRGTNSTSDVYHASGQLVRKVGGEEILSHTFDGSTYLSAIRCGAPCEAFFAIEIDGVIIYAAQQTPYQLELFFPMARYQPANNTVIKVLAWVPTSRAACRAIFQS